MSKMWMWTIISDNDEEFWYHILTIRMREMVEIKLFREEYILTCILTSILTVNIMKLKPMASWQVFEWEKE